MGREGWVLEGPVLGVQRLSLRPDAPALLDLAVDLGFRWIDVADVYGAATGDAERLVAPIVPRVRVITKGGLVRDGTRWRPDGRAGHLEAAAERSLARLGRIDLYLLHAPDPRVDLRTSGRALRRLLDRGLVGAIGASNLGVHELRVLRDVVPISAVQVELSPFRALSVRSGIIEACRDLGIPVLAYRPLGGDDIRKIRRDPVIQDSAARLGCTPEEAVLSWLESLGVTPVPGPTREATLRSCLRRVPLDPALDVLEPGRLRRPRRERSPREPDGDVVLVVGSPGSGKTTRVAGYVGQGYARLNRDDRGGRLDDLLPELDRLLVAGQRRVVLDNTYATRASRNGVVEVAWARGAPVRVEHVTTGEDDCEVNLVGRVLDHLGRLPHPEEIERLNREQPGIVPPRALTRYREEHEPLDEDEGFTAIERVPFVRRPARGGGILVLDPRHLRPDLADRLRGRPERLVVVGWQPAPYAAHAEIVAAIRDRAASLGLDADVGICPHGAGPQVCWCRKPLVGLVVEMLRKHAADPQVSTVADLGPAERTMARKLGMKLVSL